VRCYQQNQDLIDVVWQRIQRRWRGYPAGMRALARELVATLGPKPQAFFSGPDAGPLLHFPIWLAGRSLQKSLPDLLEATALAYFYVRIQDNVVDEPATRGKPPLLLLGNVLLADAIDLLARFAPSLAFWAHAKAAWTLFSEETECERQQIATSGRYRFATFRRHSRKVALARIPLYAVLARTKQTKQSRQVAFRQVDQLIDCMGEAYGLVNDVLGRSRDLASGANTHLLATARAMLPRSRQRDPKAVERVLIAQPLFERFFARAIEIHRRALPFGEALGIRAMRPFTEERIARIEHHTRQMTTLRLAAALAQTTPRQ
jgi:hypothetical protein